MGFDVFVVTLYHAVMDIKKSLQLALK